MKDNKISVGIIGGSGYTGRLLLKFCNDHAFVRDYSVYGNSTAGQTLHDVFPQLKGIMVNQVIGSVNDISMSHDVYFLALPHGEALNYVPGLICSGKKVIDLGGDYRLDTPELYEKWYGKKHTSPELLVKKQYGLADFYNDDISETQLIANPGCYPTSVLLSLLPLVKNHAGSILTVSTVSYSGTSGAGKAPKTDLLMSEMFGNVRAYNVNKHRHQPEIFQELKKNGFNSPFAFTTHLLPVDTGIYSTTTVHLKEKIDRSELDSCYASAYAESGFVRLRELPPDLRWVTGTNFCDINVSSGENTIIITATIDNLIKGAAGQAIQNMNKIFGWEEKTGLIAN